MKGQGVRAERLRGRAADHEAKVDAVVGKAQKVHGLEGRGELAGEQRGVLGAYPEADKRPNVAEHSVPDFGVKPKRSNVFVG